jgi:uncharacterized protein (DUF1800 family)
VSSANVILATGTLAAAGPAGAATSIAAATASTPAVALPATGIANAEAAVSVDAADGAPPAALQAPLGIDGARILLSRTGFGATPAEIAAFAPLTRSAAVERLLAATVVRAATPPPPGLADVDMLARPPRDVSDAARQAFRRAQVKEGLALRAWWLREMLSTPSPLSERMTLFWHDHFATSQRKVRLAALMYRQNATLRANAVGNFGVLLHVVARDPAMMIWLDTVQNRRGHPNENFAREVMELFTLGEGHYGEQDVQEAARAFTGWSIDRASGAFGFRPRLHDNGMKTVLGHTGNFDGDGVLDVIVREPRTAQFITEALWREFVSPDPDPQTVARIAARFRASGYDIKVALRDLFNGDAMYTAAARGVQVKSPVDLVVGTLHTLGVAPDNLLPYAAACAGMGQNLFAPPNVRGWPGGEAWINSGTLLARKQFLARIARADNFGVPVDAAHVPMAGDSREAAFDAGRWMAAVPAAAGRDARERALRILLPLPPAGDSAITGDTPNIVRTALQDAVYQLE